MPTHLNFIKKIIIIKNKEIIKEFATQLNAEPLTTINLPMYLLKTANET